QAAALPLTSPTGGNVSGIGTDQQVILNKAGIVVGLNGLKFNYGTGALTSSGPMNATQFVGTGGGAAVVTGTNCGALSEIPAGTGGFGIGPGCVPQTHSNGAGWVNVGAGQSLAWSGNTNPTGNLALSMGANTSTFTIGDLGSGV